MIWTTTKWMNSFGGIWRVVGGGMGRVSVAMYRNLGNFCLALQRESFSLDGLSAFSAQQRNCGLFLFEWYFDFVYKMDVDWGYVGSKNWFRLRLRILT